MLACKCRSDSDVVWVNKVGTFGISSASYWWSRLFGILGRIVGRLMAGTWFYQVVYVDDVQAVFSGPTKIFGPLGLGNIPFALQKFRGEPTTDFVGYHLRFDAQQVGINRKRGDWLVKWIDDCQAKKFVVLTRSFSEFVGWLGFVAQVLIWLKPHLAPLYSWAAALHRSMAGRLPDTVILTVQYIRHELLKVTFLMQAQPPQRAQGQSFRTDAKCEPGQVVLGGWEVHDDPMKFGWFCIVVTPFDVPYLFDAEGSSAWASAAARNLGCPRSIWTLGGK